MGLDTVELVMDIEEFFGIELTDDKLENINTVDDFTQLVSRIYLDKYQPTEKSSRQAFNLLKKTLAHELGLSEEDLKPQTQTKDVFPIKSLKYYWKKIAKETNLKLPKMEPSPSYKKKVKNLTLIFWILTILVFVTLYFIADLSPIFWSTLLFSFVLLFCLVLFAQINNTAKTQIPSFCSTLEQLSVSIVCLNPGRFGNPDKTEIFEILRNLISNQSGIEPENIKPETSFHKIFPYG